MQTIKHQRIDAHEVKQLAQGNWIAILTALGVPHASLTNKHQPCPCCGGTDRFRFDDIEGKGTFICTHYANGAGDGLNLVMHWLQCDFKEALSAVAGVLGLLKDSPIPKIAIKEPKTHIIERKDDLARLVSIYNKTSFIDENSPIKHYLSSRGLDWEAIKGFNDASLRFNEAMPYWQGKRLLGHYPAMIGLINDINGQAMGLHRTYLQCKGQEYHKLALFDQDNMPLKAKKWLSRYHQSTKGCAIQLYPCHAYLAVCEGIETAFAVREITGLPVWACLSAHNLKNFVLPTGLRELYIYADNDSHKTNIGYQSAHDLAVRAIKAGIKVSIWQSETAGFDALDELNQAKKAAAMEVSV